MNKKHLCTVILAYLDRYVFVFIPLVVPCLIGKNPNERYLLTGILCVLFALYQLIGYLCRWKHIFCSYQNAYRRKMTPECISWNKVKKSDAYGIPAVLFILGTLIIILSLLER